MTQPEDRLSIKVIISYALPTFGMNAIMMSIGIFLPNFYTDELGVTAAMLSWVFLFGRIWDAVTDPAIGHLSDRTRSRWGRRRPFFLASAVPLGLCYYFIWSPLSSLSSTGTFVHLFVCYIALYTFWTMFFIPHYSLGLEYTDDYHQRSRIFGGRQIFGIAGSVFGTFLPVIFATIYGSKVAGYPILGLVLGGASAVLILAMFFYIREREDRATSPRYPFFKGLRVTFSNRAFLILMFVYMSNTVGHAFLAPMTMYAAKYVVKEEWIVQYLVLSYMASSLLSIPLWLAVAKRIGKNLTWTISMVIAAVGFCLIYFMKEGWWLPWWIACLPTGMGSGCTTVLGPSIQADVVDSDELETGSRREGAFFGIISFIDKAAIGVAVFIGLQGLSWIGYVPNMEQTVVVKTGVKILLSFLPAALTLVALLIFQMFPITREIHTDIRAKLETRRGGQAVAESTDS